MRATATNTKAVWAFLAALASLAALGAVAFLARRYGGIRLEDALVAVPIALVLGLVGTLLARRARLEHQRRLGRSGNRGLIALVRIVSTVALLLGVTAALALGVYAALTLVLE